MQPTELSTIDLPPPQQFDAWMGWFAGVYDVDTHDPPANGFRARSRTWALDGCAISCVKAPGIRVTRDRRHVRRNQLDHWVLTVGQRATRLIGADELAREVRPNTPFVVSMADAMVSDRPADQRLQLYLSRDRFAHLASALDSWRDQAVETPLGELLGDYLVMVTRALENADPKDLARLGEAIGAMVGACLAPRHDHADAAAQHLDAVWLEKVRQVIQVHLRAPDLGPRLICQRLSVSRTRLYRLLEADGGVARHIQRLRLREAYAMLSDPAVDQPITTIAEELCFADTSGFSRAFRREFGASPRDIRAAARSTPPTARGFAPGREATGATLNTILGAI